MDIKKKKILHVSKYYFPFIGGTEQIAKDCVDALKEEYSQKVLCFNHEHGEVTECIDGIEVYRAGCFAKISSQALSISYKKILKDVLLGFDPDIVVFHYPNPFVAHYLLKYLQKETKFVLYWHLDIVKQKILKYFVISQNKRLLARADKIIATSPNYIEGSQWLQSVKDKCVVVPNCINVDRMKITPEIIERANVIKDNNAGKTICIAVGRHTEYKGFSYLIQASKLLDDSFIIYITGSGELTERLHHEAQNDNKIVFLGNVVDTELKALMYAADIFCFSSITKNEAFGLALAEAMYYEKPAVTFNIPGSGVNYVCLDGCNGIEVENRNIEAYAEAIMKLSKDDILRKKYGEAGKQRVVDNFLSSTFSINIVNEINNI